MDKSAENLIEALRKLAEARDRELHERSLPPEVLARLKDRVAKQFPIEAALRFVALRRDHSLNDRRLEMPPHVLANIIRPDIVSAEPDFRRRHPFPLNRWVRGRSWVGLAAALAFTLSAPLIVRLRPASNFRVKRSPQIARATSGDPVLSVSPFVILDRSNPNSPETELSSLWALSSTSLLRPTDESSIRLDLPLEQLLYRTESIWGP